MAEKFILGITDCVVIVVALMISAFIGLCFRIFGGNQKTNDEYLFAGRNMSIFPAAFSLMTTFMTATTLIGIPAEMYQFGTNMAFMNVGFMIGPVISSFVFLPIYFEARISTIYEYIVKRFGESTRRILIGIFLFKSLLYNGVVLYGPALALSAVTNLSLWTSVISVGVVCTFYSTMGGMKAIMWTDVFHAFLMYICLLSILIIGCIDLGGLRNIFKSAYDGGRILLPTFEFDFSRRYTMWSILLQSLIFSIHGFGVSQLLVQGQLTLRNIKRSRIAIVLSSSLVVVFQLLCCMAGLIIYVNFKTCDPITSPAKPIHSADQLLPYYILFALRQYPGISGLCIAGTFGATLSIVSSAINSLAAVTCEDIIHTLWPGIKGSVIISKVGSILYGVLSILFTYFVASMGNLIEATFIVVGMISGPSLGLYLLAALTTTANEMGANIGVLVSFVLSGYLMYITCLRNYSELPFQSSNCSEPVTALNFTTTISTTEVEAYSPESLKTTGDDDFIPVSYMWVSPLSIVVCVIVGYLTSWIVSLIRGKSETVPSELLSPVRQWFMKKQIESETKAVTCNGSVVTLVSITKI